MCVYRCICMCATCLKRVNVPEKCVRIHPPHPTHPPQPPPNPTAPENGPGAAAAHPHARRLAAGPPAATGGRGAPALAAGLGGARFLAPHPLHARERVHRRLVAAPASPGGAAGESRWVGVWVVARRAFMFLCVWSMYGCSGAYGLLLVSQLCSLTDDTTPCHTKFDDKKQSGGSVGGRSRARGASRSRRRR
jgi:hypothetical protein